MTSMNVTGAGLIIRFAQGDEAFQAASAQDEIHSVAAERKCRAHIASHPTDNFTVKVSGVYPSPALEVKIKRSLLWQLPLLEDVQSSTPDGESIPAPADLPCTIWGLVSLLILMGGDVSVEKWFGGDPALQDPSLPANTLLAASFMGCNPTVAKLTRWLKTCVQALSGSLAPFASSSTHRMKVLRCGPPEHEKAVFVGSVADSKTAVNLPASLLAKWIAFSKGDIDLRSQQLPLEQWMKLVAAICMAPPGAVKSLHMSMPHLENDQMVVMSALRSIMAHITHLQYLGLHAFSWRASQINSLIRCFLNASAA